MTPAQQSLFTLAAQRLMGIITADLGDVAVTNLSLSSCVANQAAITETIDDVIVYATIKAIDGPGLILASAGPCYVRSVSGGGTGNNTPIIGVMSFDSADLNTLSGGGSLQEVITHEMLHVLGVGSLWGSCSVCFNLLTGAGTADPQYTAAQARAGCQATGGLVSCANTVPVENIGGSGTRDSHWRETIFGSELMTGFINANANPISSITIGALQDLGYSVNSGDNDAYTIAAGSIVLGNSLGALSPPSSWERLNHVPLYSIDAYGNVRLVRKAQ